MSFKSVVAIVFAFLVVVSCTSPPRPCTTPSDCEGCQMCQAGICQIDPDQLNACGQCGPLPEETCADEIDNDCDGETDEHCCGNGLREDGEICDGDCPESCDDGDDCTRDRMIGDSGTCDVRCEHAPVMDCVSGDRCCPAGCHANNDADCLSECGNGEIEGNETCDGNCPVACDDQDACTKDRLTGSPAGCDVKCVFAAIDDCLDGDGCCPMGCHANNDADCQPHCGNGEVEGDEICDGDCPQSCDDGDDCTRDRMIGDSGTCDVRCEHAPVMDCVGGDRCCPAGCHANNDADCLSECGNGEIEGNETCDGDCPDTCDDQNDCTSDRLTGNPADCDARCVYTPISDCIGGDGCCPADCHTNNDPDCDPVCGNNEIEGDEICDGNCPQSCDDGQVCTTDWLLGSPDECSAACNHAPVRDCGPAEGCCPADCSWLTDGDCPVCSPGDHPCAGFCCDWSVNILQEGYSGIGNSLAFDANGRALISYFGPTDLELAVLEQDGWRFEVVDDLGRAGVTTSLVVRDAVVHIAYQAPEQGLKYAVSTETGWDVQLVYPECYYYQVSLRLDSEARPHISFRDKTTLRHAHLTRDGWQADALQEGAGLFNALVLNSADEPLIAFYDQTKPALKLAQWQAGEFRIQVVDDSGDAGNSVSMVIDERDLVHLAYRDQASDLLKVATGHAGCDDWDIRVVDSKAGSGWYSSLALDEAGRVHLAYVWTLNGSHELRLARNLTGTWEVFSGIDTRTDLGYASLAFLDGKPRISYHKGGFTSNGSQLCFASW